MGKMSVIRIPPAPPAGTEAPSPRLRRALSRRERAPIEDTYEFMLQNPFFCRTPPLLSSNLNGRGAALSPPKWGGG